MIPVLAAGGLAAFFAGASITQGVLGILGTILQWLVNGVGALLLLAVNVLIAVAQYTGFGDARAVNIGWAIIRDLTNMLFILVMLVIAFGTILGIEEYSYRKTLRRLLLMAVLINFSKVIAGVFIDLSQVVMMTFVNGFAAVAGANIVSLLKINTFFALDPRQLMAATQGAPVPEAAQMFDQINAFLLALILMSIALAVVVILMITLVFRVIMLWLLVILSPLAFMLSAIPWSRGGDAYKRWWEEFGNYLIFGPFVAFFLWLSFAVAGTADVGSDFPAPAQPAGGEGQRTEFFISSIGGGQNIVSYVVGISLLLGGMVLSQKFSVMGGSMMGNAAGWVKDKGTKIAKAPLGAMRKGAELGWKGAKLGASAGALAVYSRTGVDLRPSKYKEAAKAMLTSTKTRLEKQGMQAAVRRGAVVSSPQVLQEIWGQGGLKLVADITAARRGRAVGADASRRSDAMRSQEKDLREQAKRVMDEPTWFEQRATLTNREAQITAELQRVDLTPAARENLQKEFNQVRLNAAELDDRRDQNLVQPDAPSADAVRTRLEAQADAISRAAAPIEETARKFTEPRIAVYERVEQEDMEKARKEVPDYTMDTGDIVRRFVDAVKEGKSAEARIFAEVAAKQGDMGDLLQESGKELRGRAYATDKTGIEEFRREILGTRLGMNDQKSMRVMHGLGEKTDDRSFKAHYAVNGNTGSWRSTTSEEQLSVMLKKIDGLSPKRLAETLKPSDLQVIDERGNKVISALGQAILEKIPGAIGQAMATNKFDVKTADTIKSMSAGITAALGAQGQTIVRAAEKYSSSAVAQRSNIDRLVHALETRVRRP